MVVMQWNKKISQRNLKKKKHFKTAVFVLGGHAHTDDKRTFSSEKGQSHNFPVRY